MGQSNGSVLEFSHSHSKVKTSLEEVTIQMAEQKKLREGTLKLLKSVLNPNKNGWPLKKLEREYKWLVGGNIPFEKLGFSNLKDFLQDIPEIVLLEFDEKQKLTICKDTETEKIRTNIKKNLKIFLKANKKGCSLDKLSLEYNDCMGEFIPYMKLGYQGLEYFLRDIPDIVFIEEIGEGEDITKIAKIAQEALDSENK